MFELKAATIIVPNRDQNDEKAHTNNIIGCEMTYTHAPTGVLHHYWRLKLGVFVMVVRKTFHIHLRDGRMFNFTSFSPRFIGLSSFEELREI